MLVLGQRTSKVEYYCICKMFQGEESMVMNRGELLILPMSVLLISLE